MTPDEIGRDRLRRLTTHTLYLIGACLTVVVGVLVLAVYTLITTADDTSLELRRQLLCLATADAAYENVEADYETALATALVAILSPDTDPAGVVVELTSIAERLDVAADVRAAAITTCSEAS